MSGQPSYDDRFAIGEVAIWIDSDEGPDEVTIIGPREFEAWSERSGLSSGIDYGYDVRYRDGDTGFEPEKYLRKRRPPTREDHQLTTWEKCLWKPEQVTA